MQIKEMMVMEDKMEIDTEGILDKAAARRLSQHIQHVYRDGTGAQQKGTGKKPQTYFCVNTLAGAVFF